MFFRCLRLWPFAELASSMVRGGTAQFSIKLGFLTAEKRHGGLWRTVCCCSRFVSALRTLGPSNGMGEWTCMTQGLGSRKLPGLWGVFGYLGRAYMCCNAIYVMVHLHLSMYGVIYNPCKEIYRKNGAAFFHLHFLFGRRKQTTLVALQVQQFKKHRKKKRISLWCWTGAYP